MARNAGYNLHHRNCARLKLSNSRLAQFLQFVEAGSALPDVKQQLRDCRVRGVLREFKQGFASWAADALRVGKVLMDDSIECIDQLFFIVHRCGFRKYAQAESHDQQFLSMKICMRIEFPKPRG